LRRPFGCLRILRPIEKEKRGDASEKQERADPNRSTRLRFFVR
jgi:hypothetical protein